MRSAKITLGLATVLLGSCALLSPEDPLAHVQFDAEASVDTGVVHFSLFVTNGSRDELFFMAGGCNGYGAALLVYDLAGNLVSGHRPRDPWPPGTFCLAFSVEYHVQPGETLRIDDLAWVSDVLRNTPEGRYALVVASSLRPYVPDSEIPVGEFDLEFDGD